MMQTLPKAPRPMERTSEKSESCVRPGLEARLEQRPPIGRSPRGLQPWRGGTGDWSTTRLRTSCSFFCAAPMPCASRGCRARPAAPEAASAALNRVVVNCFRGGCGVIERVHVSRYGQDTMSGLGLVKVLNASQTSGHDMTLSKYFSNGDSKKGEEQG